MDERDLYWLAGLLEGEGWFCMINQRSGGHLYRYPEIGCDMSDEDVIFRAAKLMGLKVQNRSPRRATEKYPEKRHWKVQYRVTARNTKALELMEMLYPLMSIRRRDSIDEIRSEWLANGSKARRPSDDPV